MRWTMAVLLMGVLPATGLDRAAMREAVCLLASRSAGFGLDARFGLRSGRLVSAHLDRLVVLDSEFDAVRDAVEHPPANLAYYAWLADLADLAELPEAEAITSAYLARAQEAVDAKPDDDESRLLLCRALDCDSRQEEALDVLEPLLRGANPMAHAQAAWIHAEKGMHAIKPEGIPEGQWQWRFEDGPPPPLTPESRQEVAREVGLAREHLEAVGESPAALASFWPATVLAQFLEAFLAGRSMGLHELSPAALFQHAIFAGLVNIGALAESSPDCSVIQCFAATVPVMRAAAELGDARPPFNGGRALLSPEDAATADRALARLRVEADREGIRGVVAARSLAAVVWYLDNDGDAVERWLRRAVHLDPQGEFGTAAALAVLGQVDRYPVIVELGSVLLERRPTAELHLALATAYLRLGQAGAARLHARAAADDPDHAGMARLTALAADLLSDEPADYARAAVELDRLLREIGDDDASLTREVQVAVHIVNALLGDETAARRGLQQVLAEDDDHRAATQALKALDP